MQFFDARENAFGEFSGESARCMDRSSDADQTRLQWLGGIALVSLLHAGLLAAYLLHASDRQTLAEPLPMMEVALIAAPVSQPAKQPAAPAPPVAQPKPQPKPKPKPVKPKKAPAPVKKSPPITKAPAIAKPAPESAPAAMPERAAPASSSSTSTPASSPAPASAPASAPSKPKSETFTEANFRANYKLNPKPLYPRLAKSRGWQGKVLLRVKVTADGHSAEVAVQQSSGHDMLDQAAIETVKNWTFIPAKRGDTPVASTVTVPIAFQLND